MGTKRFLCILLCIPFLSIFIYGQDYSKKEKESFLRNKVDEKIEDFQEHLKFIADKNNSKKIRNEFIKATERLFYEQATIEVSNVNTGRVRAYRIGEYLRHLRDLKYFQTEIDFAPHLTQPIQEINDNTYEVVGEYKQSFRGKDRTGRLIYSDYTIKKITAKIKKKYDSFGEKYYWEVKFYKIEVEKTQKLEK